MIASKLVVEGLVICLIVRTGIGGVVNKCCPQGQHLDDGLSCIPVGGGTRYSGPTPSLPCPLDEADLALDEHLVTMEDGSLTLDGLRFPTSAYCLDRILDANRTQDVAVLCPCRVATCVRKCCNDDKSLMFLKDHKKDSKILCIPSNESDLLWIPEFEEEGVEYYILNGLFPSCKNGFYLLNEDAPFVNYTLNRDGSVEAGTIRIPQGSYCVDTSTINGHLTPNLVACTIQVPTSYRPAILYAVLYLVGALFLSLTLLVHVSLPELRKTVHTRNLTSHIVCLLLGYLILSAMSLGFSPRNKALCTFFAFSLQFTFLSAFFWLNVMCIDIAWTFSGYKPPVASSISESDGKKYLYYSIYVWFFTLLIVLLTLGAEFTSVEFSGRLNPNFGLTKCWFGSKLPALVFFYLPLSILFILNAVLFIFTSVKIIQTKRNSAILQRTDTYKHQGSRFSRYHERRVILYFKLFLLMGITWIFDVISWAVDDEDKYIIFYITDGINALRGVLIFFLFCCKAKTVELLKTKISILGKIQLNFKKFKPNLLRQPTETSTFQYPTSTQFTQLTE